MRKFIESFKTWSHPDVSARACPVRTKTQEKVGYTYVVSTSSVRIFEHADTFRSTQTGRRTFWAWGTFSACELRSATNLCNVRVTHVPSTSDVRTTHVLCVSCVLRTLNVRGLRLLSTYLNLFSNKYDELTWTYETRTCSALITHVMRTDVLRLPEHACKEDTKKVR